VSEQLRVWIDQDLCTGDGLCVQYAPEVFEFDMTDSPTSRTTPASARRESRRGRCAERLRLDVIDSAKECPGDCIHVVRSDDGAEVAGPDSYRLARISVATHSQARVDAGSPHRTSSRAASRRRGFARALIASWLRLLWSPRAFSACRCLVFRVRR